jgi:hypothetical protein
MGSTSRHTELESACDLCAQQKINSSFKSEPYIKRKVFHEPCQSCDKFVSRSHVYLCPPCQHRRIRHLLACVPKQLQHLSETSESTYKFFNVQIQPFSPRSTGCDFCQFLTRCSHESAILTRNGQIDKDVSHVYTISLPGLGPPVNGIDAQQQSYGMSSPGSHTRIFASRLGKDRKHVPTFIDWPWLKKWLHDVPETALGGLPPDKFALRSDLKDVRVIDVIEQCVVRLPTNADYVALSYVWGHIPEGRLRIMKSNIEDLGQPRALAGLKLPRTIADALIVCQQLDFQFLWVDSLCIVQDESPENLAQQLNQMANIYNRATLTLVAATGDSAAHGLAGVSYARDARQHSLRFDDEFEDVREVPFLHTCLRRSTWATRGWTYQEYVFSQKLLFFTDYGLYQKSNFGSPDNIAKSEGPLGVSNGVHYEKLNLSTVEEFTRRSLTDQTDLLRASAGFLQVLYGDRLLFGMPLDEFDSAILWIPTGFGGKPRQCSDIAVFPSWSWASSSSPVRFLRRYRTPFGLARYGRRCSNNPNEPAASSWEIISPRRVRSQAVHPLRAFAYFGLAWLNGCIESKAPFEVLMNVDSYTYASRLSEKWQYSHVSLWDDAHNNPKQSTLFDDIFESSLCRPGQIVVRAQKISFALDLRGQDPRKLAPGEGHIPALIRATDNKLAGFIELDDFAVQHLRASNKAQALFIALSVYDRDETCTPIRLEKYTNYYFRHLSVSDFYGCPCALDSAQAADLEHFAECPQHASFLIPSLDQSDAIMSYGSDEHKLACTHHLRQQSYHDFHGKTVHEEGYPPLLWVMMIAPSENERTKCMELNVYRRLGIGRIWLKKWVEVKPAFETFFLE